MTVRKNTPCRVSNLQALVDDQLAGPERDQVVQHVLNCADCKAEYEHLKAMAQFVENELVGQQSLEIPSLPLKLPVPNEALSIQDSDVELGWMRLKERLENVAASPAWGTFDLQVDENLTAVEPGSLLTDQNVSRENQTAAVQTAQGDSRRPMSEQTTMQPKRFWQKKLPRVAAAAAVVVLGTGIFTTNLGNKALAAMLQTFRVQHLVGVNQDDFSQITQQLQSDNGGHIDLKQYGQIDSQGQNASKTVSIAEASQLMGHPIKPLPGTDPQNNLVSYASGSDIAFQLHTGPINTLLQRLGGKTAFPATIDGKPFVFHVPPSVDLNNKERSDQQHTSYNLQILKAPSLDVPAGVDIEQVRQALLDLPFLPGNMRNSLLRTEDWKNTLFLPMGSGNVQNITLNGHEAVLNSGAGFGEVMWLQDGYIYTLEAWTDSGQSGPPHSVPSTDNLISMAKEISG